MAHIDQMVCYEQFWCDKVGYVWLVISLDPVNVDTSRRIESAADLCYEYPNDVVMDVLCMTGNEHYAEEANPREEAEI